MRADLVEDVAVDAYTVPTDGPEADGTLEWDATTIVVAEVRAGGGTGVGYSYGSASAATVAAEMLVPVLVGRPALDIPAAFPP